MTLFFANARLIDPETLTETLGNVVVDGGIIAAIGPMHAPAGAQVIDCKGHCLAPGIVDIGVKIGEPGERHKESYASAGRAAAAGGVTTMVVRPDTLPPVDSPESLDFVIKRAQDAPVRVRHMAALTKAREGHEMVEMAFLRDAGAVAFTDGVRVVAEAKLFGRCMTYARGLAR